MLGTVTLATRPLAAAPRLPRPYKVAAVAGEFGWAAWSFSRQAKLNAWAWHGLGQANILGAAVLGNSVYVRKDTDDNLHVMTPDSFYAEGEVSTDSLSCEATTPWLDMGQPARTKALTGIDMDARGITAVEVYISEGGDRTGVLAETIPIGDADGGWTYNSEVVPVTVMATEFKLRFIFDNLGEAALHRLSLHWDAVP